MKKILNLMHVLAIVVACKLLTLPAYAENLHFSLDKDHTTVAFLVEHVGYAKTLGYFTDVSGSFSFDATSNTVSDVNITIATQSVQTANEARDKHLRNKDFLHVKKHPTMTFTATSVQIDADGAGRLAGELTLLGNTQIVTLDVTLNKSAKYPFGHKRFTLGVSASGVFKRSAFGMSYGVADALVGDEVEMIIEIEAIQDK